MALRLIEIYHKLGKADEMDFLLKDMPTLETWHEHLPDNNDSITKVLVKGEQTESIINLLQDYFIDDSSFRVIIIEVEATLPRPKGEERDVKTETEGKAAPVRISLEELYQKMMKGAGLSRNYMVMVILESVVAAIGLLKNDVAVIISRWCFLRS